MVPKMSLLISFHVSVPCAVVGLGASQSVTGGGAPPLIKMAGCWNDTFPAIRCSAESLSWWCGRCVTCCAKFFTGTPPFQITKVIIFYLQKSWFSSSKFYLLFCFWPSIPMTRLWGNCVIYCVCFIFFYLTDSANQVRRPGQFSMSIFSADTGSLMAQYSKKKKKILEGKIFAKLRKFH